MIAPTIETGRTGTGGRDDQASVMVETLARLQRAMRSTAHRLDLSEVGVRRSDLYVLKVVHRLGQARARDIACELGVDASVVSRQLAQLVDDGLVERDADPEDRRSSILSLTERGDRALVAADAAYAGYVADLTAGWTPERFEAVTAGLADLADALAAART